MKYLLLLSFCISPGFILAQQWSKKMYLKRVDDNKIIKVKNDKAISIVVKPNDTLRGSFIKMNDEAVIIKSWTTIEENPGTKQRRVVFQFRQDTISLKTISYFIYSKEVPTGGGMGTGLAGIFLLIASPFTDFNNDGIKNGRDIGRASLISAGLFGLTYLQILYTKYLRKQKNYMPGVYLFYSRR